MAELSYGLDVEQVREYIVRPAEYILALPSAQTLVLGTGMCESQLRYVDQIDRESKPGPAYGLFQMERATHDDIWRNYLDYHSVLRARILAYVTPASLGDAGIPDAASMQWNHLYAAMMCRVHYRRVPRALPDPKDAVSLAAYWKTYYNTPRGKGTVAKALSYFQRAVILPGEIS